MEYFNMKAERIYKNTVPMGDLRWIASVLPAVYQRVKRANIIKKCFLVSIHPKIILQVWVL